MSAPSKVNVALSAELNELLEQAVASGEYATSSEIIGEALQEWSLRRRLKTEDNPALVDLWNEGIASGPGGLKSMADIKAEARRRLEQSRFNARN